MDAVVNVCNRDELRRVMQQLDEASVNVTIDDGWEGMNWLPRWPTCPETAWTWVVVTIA